MRNIRVFSCFKMVKFHSFLAYFFSICSIVAVNARVREEGIERGSEKNGEESKQRGGDGAVML